MLYVKILGIFARTCKDFIAFFVGLIGLLGSIHRHILRRSACISYPSGALRFEGSPAWEWRLLVAQTSHLLRPHTKICLCGVQYAKCPAQPQNAFFSPLRPESFEAQKNKKHGEHTILTDQHHFRILKWWLPTNLQMMILEVGIFQSISWFHFPTSSSFTSTWPHVRNPQSIAMCMYEDYEVHSSILSSLSHLGLRILLRGIPSCKCNSSGWSTSATKPYVSKISASQFCMVKQTC